MLRAPEPEVRPAPGIPVWNRYDTREHLSFLNSSSAAARAPGTEALATAAEYVASRMGGYRLQPVYDQGFRMRFNVPTHRIDAAQMSVAGADSVALSLGYDFAPDPRSASGNASMNFIHVAPEGDAVPFPAASASAHAVMITGSDATTDRLQALADSGFRLVLVAQDLAPRAAARPVRGLLVVQVPPRTAAWLMGLPRPEFDRLWEQPEVLLRSLPRRLIVEVVASTFPSVEAVNVAGYVAGGHPTLSRDLVIVASNLDALPLIADERVIDYRSYGIGLTAMLEVARNEIAVSRQWTHPMRSLMFVAVTGRDAVGLSRLLEASPWEMSRIRAVIYVGLREEDEAEARQVLASQGIPLEVVRHPDQIFERRFVFSSERSARSRSPLPLDETSYRGPESSVIMTRAVEAAFTMANETHRLVQSHAGLVPSPASAIVVQTQP